jgi:hypothetical protein
MADYLVYWQGFWKDSGDPGWASGDWSTKSRHLYRTVKKGDRLWVVVTGGPVAPAEWRLLESIRVSRRSLKATPWGPYHVIGRKPGSSVYDPKSQPDLAAILRLMSFSGGRRIRVKGGAIGKTLQTRGFRSLSEKDGDLLAAYAATLDKLGSG